MEISIVAPTPPAPIVAPTPPAPFHTTPPQPTGPSHPSLPTPIFLDHKTAVNRQNWTAGYMPLLSVSR
jgi:hypothetical protein